MQQSTSCWREDKWRYGDGGRRWWRMTTVADNDDTRDWVADCDGEGQERAVRDGGDSGEMMMAAVAADKDSEGRKRQWLTAMACKIGRRPMKGWKRAGGERWRKHRVAMTAVEVEDGDGG
jgi:hypothetical protein